MSRPRAYPTTFTLRTGRFRGAAVTLDRVLGRVAGGDWLVSVRLHAPVIVTTEHGQRLPIALVDALLSELERIS